MLGWTLAAVIHYGRGDAPPAQTPVDPGLAQLFAPATDFMCLPWMNRLHFDGCPMVIV